jgi:hypothetical protein
MGPVNATEEPVQRTPAWPWRWALLSVPRCRQAEPCIWTGPERQTVSPLEHPAQTGSLPNMHATLTSPCGRASRSPSTRIYTYFILLTASDVPVEPRTEAGYCELITQPIFHIKLHGNFASSDACGPPDIGWAATPLLRCHMHRCRCRCATSPRLRTTGAVPCCRCPSCRLALAVGGAGRLTDCAALPWPHSQGPAPLTAAPPA